MTLTRGDFGEYDFNRMVVRFTMKNDQADVACAISTDAMDQLEGSSRMTPAQREQQFLRLRDRIEARAAKKFSDVELEGNPPGVILRAIFACRADDRATGPRRRIEISNRVNGQILPGLVPPVQDAD
jgi:hypothetical protein